MIRWKIKYDTNWLKYDTNWLKYDTKKPSQPLQLLHSPILFFLPRGGNVIFFKKMTWGGEAPSSLVTVTSE